MEQERQTIGMFLTDEDEARFESYTKEQIYEAYLTEYVTRKKHEEEVVRLKRRIAEIRYLAR